MALFAVFLVVALVALFFVSACGGATPEVPVRVSFYGDSITRGDGLSPRPVERRTELAKGVFTGVDYALGGATVQAATLGDARLPFAGRFGDWIKQDSSEIVVLGYAGANALGGMENLAEYETLLTNMIRQAQAAGKVVVLSGITFVHTPVAGVSDADAVRILAALATFDGRTQAIAAREGCHFLDVRTVPFYGAVDMLDNVHPSQAYSDRVSAYVTAYLVGVVGMRTK